MRSLPRRWLRVYCVAMLLESCDSARAPPEPRPAADLTPGATTALPAELIKQGRYEEAERSLRGSVDRKNEPASSPGQSRYLLSLALAGQGRLEEALVEARGAAGAAPRNPEVRRGLANLLLKRENVDDAIAQYREALALGDAFRLRTGMPVPDSHRWRYELAQALLRAGRREEAERELDAYQKGQAAEIELKAMLLRAREQGTAAAHCEYGEALARHGKPGEAVQAFRAALAIDDGMPRAHLSLARAYVDIALQNDSGDAAGPSLVLAEAHARRAIESQESTAAHLILARAARARGDIAACEKSLQRALELSPGDARVEEQAAELRR